MKPASKTNPFNIILLTTGLTILTLPSLNGNEALATPGKSDILEKAVKFTVRVRSSVKIPYSDDQYGSSIAAAFLVDRERGLLLTNAHVARKSPAKISVSFKNSPAIVARQAYIDTRLDLAILRISPDKIPDKATEAKLECSEKASIGEEVAAFGHPWSLDFTATRGIISGQRYRSDSEFIQTDTPLNPGNSGGALITLDTGKVIGINASVIYSKSAKTEGLGFAVPSAHACRILDLYRSGKDPSPPNVSLEFARDRTLGKNLIVARVLEDEWKEKIRVGDNITAVSGAPVSNLAQLETELRGSNGQTTLTVVRGSEKIHVAVPITKTPLITERKGVVVSGALFFPAIYRDAYQRNVFDLIQVHGVELGSEAERADLKENDLVVAINDKPVRHLSDISRLLNLKEDNTLIVRRHSRSKSRLYDHLLLRLKRPKVSSLRFQGVSDKANDVPVDATSGQSRRLAEKK